MPSIPQDNRWFISAVTEDFAAVRIDLRNVLEPWGYQVHVQEDFYQEGLADILVKLDHYIRGCAGVIHLIGPKPGRTGEAEARANAVREYLAYCSQSRDFLGHKPELLAQLGDLSGLSYTQWEALIALHHGVKLFVYAPGNVFEQDAAADDPGLARQRAHSRRLNSAGRFATRFENPMNLLGKIVKDAGLGPIKPDAEPPCEIPDPLPLFKGREDKLRDLRKAFGTGNQVVVTGLGGIGKTRIAAEYGHKFAKDYDGMLMVTADDPAKLQASVAGLAAKLRPETEAETNQDAQFKTTVHWLKEHLNWLLIVDNVDDRKMYPVVTEFIRPLRRGHILITSRFSEWPWNVKEVKLDVLSLEHSVEFLLEATEGRRQVVSAAADLRDARDIADELGRLALGLTQAAAHIRVKRIPLQKYLEKWRTNSPALMADPNYNPKVTGYDRTVAVTWVTTMQRLEPATQFLLDLLCWLGPEQIPERLLAVPDDAGEKAWSPAALAYVPEEIRAGLQGGGPLQELLEFSMVDLEAGQLSLHRLVQAVGRVEQIKAGRASARLACAAQWLADDFLGRPETIQNQRANVVHEQLPLIPHVRALLAAKDDHRPPAATVTLAQLQNALAGVFQTLGLLASAEETSLVAVAAARALDPAADVRGCARLCLSRALMRLCWIYPYRGHPAKALEPAAEAVGIARALDGEFPDDVTVLRQLHDTLWTQAERHFDQENHAAAMPFFEEALSIARRLLELEPGNALNQRYLSVAFFNLARNHLQLGALAAAEDESRQAFEITRRLHEQMPDTLSLQNDLAIGYSQLGSIQQQKGELPAALAAYRQELAIHRALLKLQPDNLGYKRDIANSLGRISNIQHQQGEQVAAGKSYLEELMLWHSVLGRDAQNISDQRDVLRIIGNLLLVTASHPDQGEAKALLEQAQTVLQRLREDNSLPDEVVELAPRLRAELHRLEESIAAERDLRERELRLAALRQGVANQPADAGKTREAADLAAVLGRLHDARNAREQADNAFQEELMLRRSVLAHEPGSAEEQEKVLKAVERIVDRVVDAKTFSGATTKRLLQHGLVLLDELAKDPAMTAAVDALSPQLRSRLRRVEEEQEYDEAMSVSRSLPVVPEALVTRLAALDIHDLAWQAAYWNLYLEPASDPEDHARVAAGRRTLEDAAAAAIPPDLEPAHVWKPAFYPGCYLALLLPPPGSPGGNGVAAPRSHAWLLVDGESAWHLAGRVEPINRLHSRIEFKVDPSHLENFLRFFCFFVRAENEPFLVVDHRMLSLLPGAGEHPAGAEGLDRHFDPRPVPEAQARGHHGIAATVLYDHAVFRSSFTVSPEGQVRMVDDQPVTNAGRPV